MGRRKNGRDTNNFNSGMTTAVARMEAIMASLVEDRARMNSRNALSKNSYENLGSVQKIEDTENSKSKPEATIGTSATVDNKVTNDEMGSSMTTNATDNTPSKKRKKEKTENNNPDLGGILSTHESTQGGLTTTKVLEVTSGELISVSAKTATLDVNMVPKGDHSEVASCKMEDSEATNNGDGAPKLTKSQKKNRRKALHKKLKANLGSSEKERDTNLNGEVEVQKRMEPNLVLGGNLSARESTKEGLSATRVVEVTSGDMISAKTTTPDVNMVPKGDHSEVASCKMEDSEATNNGDGAPKLTRSQKNNRRKALHKKLKANLGSSEKEDTNLNGEVEVQKRMEPNLGSGGIISARESTEEGLSTTKVVEVTSGDMISAKTTTPDANMVSKGDHTDVASRKMEDSEAINNGDGAPKLTRSQKNNRRKALHKKLKANLGSSKKEDTNLNGEVEVQKRMEPNLGSGGIISARESTEEGLSTTKVVEVTGGDMISAKTTTPDANMVSKGDHTDVASRKMEDSEATNNGDGAPKLTRSQKYNRRKALRKKLNANLGSSEKGEDTGISSAGTGDGKSSNSIGKEHAEVAIGETGSTTNLTGKVEVQQKMESIVGETSLGINAADDTLKKRKREKMENDNPDLGGILSTCEGTEEGLSTTKVLQVKSGEVISAKTETPDANMVSKGDHSEVASAKMEESETTINDNETTNKALDKKMNANLGSLGKREDAENLKGKPEIQFYTTSLSSIQDTKVAKGEKNSNFNGKEHTKVSSFEMGSSLTTNLNREVEVKKTMETTIGNTSLGTNATDNTISKEREIYRKKTKNNNPDLGDIISTHESAQGGVGMIKALEVTCNESISRKITTPDANMVSKEGTNIKIGESETIDVNLNGKDKSIKKPGSENKQPTLAEILNPQYSQSLEASKSETGSGTTSTDKPASKKRKRKKLNKNPDLGDMLSIRESTHEGLSTTNVLEVKNCETVSAKTATPDASMVSKEQDHTEVANGKMEQSETTNLNVIGKNNKEKEPNPKNKKPTLAEYLNPHYLQNSEASKGEKGSSSTSTSIDNQASKKHKRQKLKKNSDSGDIVSTRESTQDGLSTTNVFEVKGGETVLAKAATSDVNTVSKEQDHTEVANGKLDESETTNNSDDAPKLSKLQKKLNANLGSSEKREDTENPNSKPEAQFYSNTGIGTSATIDNKTSMSCPAGTCETGSNMTTNLNVEVEVQKKMETSSGTTAGDNTALKKRKRKRKKNNPDLGYISSTQENIQEGLSTTEALEVKNDEMVSVKTTTTDASMMLKEQDQTEVAIVKKKRKRKPESENTLPTVGENLDRMHSQNTEAADNPASKEQKRQKINNIPASGDICENTSKVVEAVSGGVPQGEKCMKYAIGDMSLRARTKLQSSVKKLLILDLNGLLADVSSDRPKDVVADKYAHGRAIFKRPYLDDFLQFCFQRFHVAVWSSRTWKKLDPLVYFLLRDLRFKLLFMWDGCQCTDSDIDTLDVKHKHVVVKDLRKIWDEDGPNNKWVKGTFNESNTLLVDDSPYKGLLNPKYTGIFPASYSYKNRDDNFLAPNGELQTYLEGLAAADDVRTYVERHPIGQGPIDEQNPNWEFYSSVLKQLNDERLMKRILKKCRFRQRKCFHGYQKQIWRPGKARR